MTHLTPSKNRKPGVLSGRISAIGLSAVAAAALMFSAGSAEAGPAEIKAIQSKLPPGVYFAPNPRRPEQQSATLEQIADAVFAVLQDARYKRLLPGVVAGEALKHATVLSDASGAAAQTIAQKALDGLPATFRTSPVLLSLSNLVGDAAKTAAAGRGANPTFSVPSFTQTVLEADASADAIAAAVRANANKVAAALILGGFADELDDQGKRALVSNAVLQARLTAAVPEVIRVVALDLPDSEIGAFVGQLADAKQVSDRRANSVAIVAGYAKAALAAKPEEAASITDALLNNADALVKSSMDRGIASYAKTVAAVADIEQISIIGSQLAARVGANSPGASIGVVAGLAKTLASAVFSKPVPVGYDLTGPGTLGVANRIDEIAEVAAYVVGGVFNNTSFSNPNGRVAKATLLNIIKGVVAGSKSTSRALRDVNIQFADLNNKAQLLADILGSVALTIDRSTLDPNLKSALAAYLQLPSTIRSIVGTNVKIQDRVKAVMALAFSTNPDDIAAANAQLENGNPTLENGNPKTLQDLIASLKDPGTDLYALTPPETPITNN